MTGYLEASVRDSIEPDDIPKVVGLFTDDQIKAELLSGLGSDAYRDSVALEAERRGINGEPS